MKKLSFLLVLLILSCASQDDTTKPEDTFPVTVSIHLNGTDSLYFIGQYGNNTDTNSVSGIIPPGNANYIEYFSSVEDTSDAVFASFQKQQFAGYLKVSFYVDDHLKIWKQTSDSFGIVYVTWKP